MEHYNCHKFAVIGDTYDFKVFVILSLLHYGPHAFIHMAVHIRSNMGS